MRSLFFAPCPKHLLQDPFSTAVPATTIATDTIVDTASTIRELSRRFDRTLAADREAALPAARVRVRALWARACILGHVQSCMTNLVNRSNAFERCSQECEKKRRRVLGHSCLVSPVTRFCLRDSSPKEPAFQTLFNTRPRKTQRSGLEGSATMVGLHPGRLTW